MHLMTYTIAYLYFSCTRCDKNMFIILSTVNGRLNKHPASVAHFLVYFINKHVSYRMTNQGHWHSEAIDISTQTAFYLFAHQQFGTHRIFTEHRVLTVGNQGCRQSLCKSVYHFSLDKQEVEYSLEITCSQEFQHAFSKIQRCCMADQFCHFNERSRI